MRRFYSLLLMLLLAAVSTAYGQKMEDKIRFLVDHPDGRYALGEQVVIRAEVPAAFQAVKEIWINGLCVEEQTCTIEAGDYIFWQGSYDEATTIAIRLLDPENRRAKDVAAVGVVVGMEHFKPGFEAPADYYDWWMKQVDRMRRERMDPIIEEVAVPGEDAAHYRCFSIEVNCREGDAPVRGYMALPRNAAPWSLPICIFAHGAGVKDPSNRSQVKVAVNYAKRGGGAIALDLNAHGMLNDQPQAYYNKLDRTTLNNYRFRPMEDRMTYYYRGMYLRMQRALDYLCTRPEWDGKRVLVVGASQGGAQSAMLAGMDPRVTHAVVRVPGRMDKGGVLLGRVSGNAKHIERFGQTKRVMRDVPYFDTAFMLAHTRAKVIMEAGLIDFTCFPSTVFVGYNLCGGDKQIVTYPFRPHGTPKGRYRGVYKKHFGIRVERFIDQALQ